MLVKLQLKATNLPKMDMVGKSDPYFKIFIIQKSKEKLLYRSETIPKCLNPEWEEAIFELPKSYIPGQKLLIRLFDQDDIGKDDYMGEVWIPLPIRKSSYRDAN